MLVLPLYHKLSQNLELEIVKVFYTLRQDLKLNHFNPHLVQYYLEPHKMQLQRNFQIFEPHWHQLIYHKDVIDILIENFELNSTED